MSSEERATTAVKVGKPSTLGYLPGLDGLRALSVIGVMLWHAELLWIPGGFLGVEVFFVISGYLITMLLMAEHRKHRSIDLGRFWMRRGRRLLPALYALLVAVSVFTVAFFRDEMAALRGQVLAALTYITNWYLIWTDQSYLDQFGRPPVLRHLWSLAVEEQFYLLWPLAVVVILRVAKGRLGVMAAIIGGAALASAVWMAILYTPGEDPSRVYYGTDTRASGLLIGALLALVWRPEKIAKAPVARAGRLFDLLGLLSVAGIAVFFFRAHATDAFLYRGGFVLLSLITLVAIAAATHPATVFGRVLLGNKALTWVGVRSYGLYLWHWPIYCYTRPGIDVSWGIYPTLAFRLGLTVLLTELSYRFLELPIRNGALGRWVRTLSGPLSERREQRRRITAALGLASLLVLVPVGSSIATAKKPVDEIEQSLRAGAQATAPPSATTVAGSPATASPGTTTAGNPGVTNTPDGSSTVAPPGTTAATDATSPPAAAGPPRIVGLGDSVMLGARPQLLAGFGAGSIVDAKVSRTLKQSLVLAQGLKDQGALGEAVVIHLGNNGSASAEVVGQMMGILSDVDRVVWVNLKLPGLTKYAYQDAVNGMLAAELPKYPNARLVDWHALGNANPAMFYDDGIHLKPSGAEFYTQQVAQALA